MARWFIRRPTFSKVLGAYRSQGRRTLMRLLFPCYGKKGMGWLQNPRKAAYNWWYNRTSVSLFSRSSSKSGGVFFALLVGLLLLPFSAFGNTSSGRKKRSVSRPRTGRTSSTGAAKRTGKKLTSGSSLPKSGRTSPSGRSAVSPEATPSAGTRLVHPAFRDGRSPVKVPHSEETPAFQDVPPPPVLQAEPFSAPPAAPDPADETVPRSTPLDPADRYIRKRMLIAGTYFADREAVRRLTVGAHLDLTAEPDNPHDPNAVALYHQGGRVGYVAKQDALSFAMCLRLKRPVYGVITDLREEDGRTVYEYETWFAAH